MLNKYAYHEEEEGHYWTDFYDKNAILYTFLIWILVKWNPTALSTVNMP